MTLKDKWLMTRQIVRQMNAQEKQEKARRKQMKVYRTTEGTVFEVVCAVLCVAIWVVEFLSMSREQVFDWGNLAVLLFITAVVAGALVAAYHPQWINNGNVKIENARQLALLVQSVRIVALLLAATFLFLSVKDFCGWQLPEWVKYIPMVIFIVLPLAYSVIINKVK